MGCLDNRVLLQVRATMAGQAVTRVRQSVLSRALNKNSTIDKVCD